MKTVTIALIAQVKVPKGKSVEDVLDGYRLKASNNEMDEVILHQYPINADLSDEVMEFVERIQRLTADVNAIRYALA